MNEYFIGVMGAAKPGAFHWYITKVGIEGDGSDVYRTQDNKIKGSVPMAYAHLGVLKASSQSQALVKARELLKKFREAYKAKNGKELDL